MSDEISQEKINRRIADVARLLYCAKSDMNADEFKALLKELRMPNTVADGLLAGLEQTLLVDISTQLLIAQFLMTLKQTETVVCRDTPLPCEGDILTRLFSRSRDLASEIDRRQQSNTYRQMRKDHLKQLRQWYVQKRLY